MAARKPTPVDVVYFPKKVKAAPRAVTQTIPEVPLGGEFDAATEVELASISPAGTPGKKRTKSSDRHQKVELAQAPSDGLADMMELGHELFTRGKVNEARVVFEGLVVSNPDDPFIHTMLGTIHLARNDLDQALGAFEKALALDPDDVPARVYRAEIRLNKKRYRAATDDLKLALKTAQADDPFAERARRLLKLATRSAKP